MNTLDFLTIAISLLGIINCLIIITQMRISKKNEYLELNITKKHLLEHIEIINKNLEVDLEQVNNVDEVKMGLHWYCHSIFHVIKELYPNCSFSVSIKMFYDNSVVTILRAGDELFINDTKQFVNQNTEYDVIINERYEYFFVTDLNKYEKMISNYENSDPEWKYKYNTSIVFPIKTSNINDSKVIGFVCVHSPQKLKKEKNNDFLIKLIKKTCNNIANYILQYRDNI